MKLQSSWLSRRLRVVGAVLFCWVFFSAPLSGVAAVEDLDFGPSGDLEDRTHPKDVDTVVVKEDLLDESSVVEGVVTISGSLSIPQPLIRAARDSNIMKDVRVILENPSDQTGGHLISRLAFVTKDGFFEFRGVPITRFNQLYSLEVTHPYFNFEQFQIEVNGRRKGRATVRAMYTDVLYTNEGQQHFVGNYEPSSTSNVSGQLTLFVRANGIKSVFEERPEFNLLSLLKNPMVMITLGMMALMWFMPKPETLDEMKREASGEAKPKSQPKKAVEGGGGGGK